MDRPRRTDHDGLYQRPGSPFWWATWTDRTGHRTRRSTRTTNRRDAEAILAGWRLEAHRATDAQGLPVRTFDALMLAYLKGPSADKRADRDRYSAKHLYPAFTGRNLATLAPSDVRRYIDDRRAAGAQPGTINREIGLLSSALNYARREWDWAIPNPAAGRQLREPEGRVRWLSKEDATRLIQSAEAEPKAGHLADFIRLALHTGCRRDELLRLEWSRVNLDSRLLLLEAQHTKAARRRSVPLNATACRALASRIAFRLAHCPGSPWVFAHEDGSRIAACRRSFMSACRRAEITDFRIHDLRHTCAAWLVSGGVPLTEVRDLLGHSTIGMTERYAHLAPERVRAAVAILDVGDD
ncbi:site-specific integrase [uncultured Thiodictyon sp.]|uniref:tyrosine-type recombinase/integrase n=1 Tax=uncultured Thiodictyon sp. TaxID=1846217 RepID=UPI0025D6503E|nr:site-specific integrase [uncultured Thiodictyon sp.]